ncbi:MAG: hypothetical protein ACK4K0_12010 [Flavobacteriales bacterium]
MENQKKLESLPNPPVVLIAGDSHAARSIEDDSLQSAFNMAYFGENPMRTYYRIKHYLKHNQPPKYIILQADAARYSGNFLQFNTNYFFYVRYVEYSELLIEDQHNPEYFFTGLKYKLLPYIEFRDVVAKNKEKKRKKAELDFCSVSDAKKEYEVQQFIRVKVLSNRPELLYDDLSLRYLEKTIKLCEKYNVEPIFIKFPVHELFTSTLRLFCGEELYNRRLQDSIINSAGYKIWDYEDYFSERCDLFIDSHHMNKRGREVFTGLLKERINSELLLEE